MCQGEMSPDVWQRWGSGRVRVPGSSSDLAPAQPWLEEQHAVPASTGAVFVPAPRRELRREHALGRFQRPAQGLGPGGTGERRLEGLGQGLGPGGAGERRLGELGSSAGREGRGTALLLASPGLGWHGSWQQWWAQRLVGRGLRGSSLISGGVW